MTKFDLTTFRQQTRAGMQGWYLMFQSELDTVIGYLGPYPDEATASAHGRGINAAETAAVEAVDKDSPWAMYPYFWHHYKVVQLTPHEIECLNDPEKEAE